mgnify:FL=1
MKRKLVLVQIGADVIILIGGRGIQFFGHYPDLEKFHRFGIASVHFAVVDTCTGTHGLNIACGDGTAVLLAVAMFQLTFQGDGDNLHILMRVGAKAFARSYPVVVQYTQAPKFMRRGL